MSRKKSLLIGINYTGSENELHGCHQDVENIAQFLSYQGYSDDPRSFFVTIWKAITTPRGTTFS